MPLTKFVANELHKQILGAMQRRIWCAFNSTSGPGVYAPWRFGNLNDSSNCGLPCANGNNSPANSNWNGVPRHADENLPEKGHKRCIAPAP